MRTPLHGSKAPFRLSSNVVYFHDWRYVDHGRYHWLGPQGEALPLWTRDPLPPAHYAPQDMPVGLRLEAQPAQRSAPVLHAVPNDIILFAGSLLHEEGRYRLWYDCWPDAMEPPHDLWYVNAKTLMPGTTDYHLMFPMRWCLLDDHFEFRLASSPDGIVWSWLPGGPACRPGAAGEWDGGVVVSGYGLVDLPGRRTGLLGKAPPCPTSTRAGRLDTAYVSTVAYTRLTQHLRRLYATRVRARVLCK
jgi:hypothetical protein